MEAKKDPGTIVVKIIIYVSEEKKSFFPFEQKKGPIFLLSAVKQCFNLFILRCHPAALVQCKFLVRCIIFWLMYRLESKSNLKFVILANS